MNHTLTRKSLVKLLTSLWWHTTGPFIRLLHVDRALWKQQVSHFMLAGGWKEALSEIEANQAFFAALPYRPAFSAPFDQEKLLLRAALAVANFQYFRNDVGGYQRTMYKIGSYLDHVLILNEYEVRESDVWADYLHKKATMMSLLGQSSNAACINCEVKQLFAAKDCRTLEALAYEGCAICCRVESLSADEQQLIAILDSQARDVARRFEELPEEVRAVASSLDIHTKKFYIHMLRCKIQAHMRSPEPAAIQAAIIQAKECRKHIVGSDASTYDVVVPFYEALLSKLLKQPVAGTTRLYNDSLAALRISGVPHFCLLRVPDSVASSLANHVQQPRLSSNTPLSRLKKTKTRQFAIKVFTILVGALVALTLFYFFSPLAEPGKGRTSLGAWYGALGIASGVVSGVVSVIKLLSERRDRGLVSPKYLTGADIASSVFLSLAIALFTAVVTGIIEHPPQ